MGTTIDNLESHFRYTVIRGFTDATGIRVPFETTGVVRKIDLKRPDMSEIYIDWERDGPGDTKTPERLTFLLAATDGPRNGHMKEYFEKGELVMPPREHKPPKPAPAAEPVAPAEPAQSFAGYDGEQPPGETLLGERTVACDCGPIFHRAIFPSAQYGVNACLRCGAVTVTRQVGDDGRFTGNAWTAYWTVPTSQILVDWLGRFPRISIDYAGSVWRWPMSASLVRYPTLFYPADARVSDEAELKALESTLGEAQAPLTRAQRLSSACGDIPRTPADLPEAFAVFGMLRQALDFRSKTDVETLKAHAHLLNPSCELAADLLLGRDDAYDLMLNWLRARDGDEFSAGIAMLRDSRRLFTGPEDPKLTQPLLEILDALPLGKLKDVPDRVESCQRFESLLVAIADLGANAPDMLEGLTALMKKLARKDTYTTDAIRLTLNELRGIDNRPPAYR
ncbi:MAG: hypothetical protein QM773_01595 [Hyphomonadaceae bacterium]